MSDPMKQYERSLTMPSPHDDPLGDAPTFEEALGLIGERGLIRDLVLLDEDLQGLGASEVMSRHRKVLFLRAFAKRGIVGDGCHAAGVSRAAVTYWKDDPWFKPLYDAAMEEAADVVEAELHRRAVEGVDEPVMYQGQPTTYVDESGRNRVLTVKKYSDPLISLLAKGVRREKFGDKIDAKVDLTARVGVLVVPGLADPREWAAAAEAEQAKYAGNTGEESVIEHNKGG